MTTGTSSGICGKRLYLSLVLCIITLVQVKLLQAAVFACPTASGGTIFQDRPCPMPSVAQQEATVARSQLPAGMHASWFDRPEHADGKAVCDTQGCQCGRIERGHGSGLNFAVADSLYLDGNWHRYEEAVSQWKNTDAQPAQRGVLRAGVSDSACDILISQETLRRFAAESLRDMRRKARNAEDRGSDYPELCDTDPLPEAEDETSDLAGFDLADFTVMDEQACERYTDLLRYRSMVNDAQALRMPRTGVINATGSEDQARW